MNINNLFSLLKGKKGNKNLGAPPCWVTLYKYILYAADINIIKLNGTTIQEEIKKEVIKSKISLNKLIDGGPAIFATQPKNHHIEIIGVNISIPFDKNNLREKTFSYLNPAKANNKEEHKPWAIIITNLPCQPNNELDKIPPTIKDMCPTEAYAISDLISVCRKQIKLTITPPHNLKTTINIITHENE